MIGRRGECTIVSAGTVTGKKLIGARVSGKILKRQYPPKSYMILNVYIIQPRKGSRIKKETYTGRSLPCVTVKDIVYDDEWFETDE